MATSKIGHTDLVFTAFCVHEMRAVPLTSAARWRWSAVELVVYFCAVSNGTSGGFSILDATVAPEGVRVCGTDQW